MRGLPKVSKVEHKSQLCGALTTYLLLLISPFWRGAGGGIYEGVRPSTNRQTSPDNSPCPCQSCGSFVFRFFVFFFFFTKLIGILVTVYYSLAPWSYCWVPRGGGPKPQHSSKGLPTAGGGVRRGRRSSLMALARCRPPGSASQEGEGVARVGGQDWHTGSNREGFRGRVDK